MKNILILIIIAVAFVSCTKDLDQQPISASSPETFFNSRYDFIQGVNATYGQLSGYPERQFFIAETRSDNIYGVSDGGVRDWEGVNDFWPTLSSNIYLPQAWNGDYNGILRANIVLDQLQKKGGIVSDVTLRNRLKGEAKFLRAFYYFDLVKTFGKVPVFDHPNTPAEALTTPRSPVSDVYALIIADLQYAKDSLLAVNAAADLGRPTQYSAKSMLALVYMTRSGPTYSVEGPGLGLNEWNLAATLLDDIINSGKFTFAATQKEIFRFNNEYNKEVVYDINFVSGQTPVVGTHFPVALVPEFFAQAKGIATIGGSDIPVSNSLRNAFTSADNRKASTIHCPFIYNKTIVDTMWFYQKYLDTTAFPANRVDWPINFIVSRYTDILLLRAECTLNGASGSQADVDAAVNKVRNRAGLPSISNVTKAQLFAERRLEFAGEAIRWNDLVRSGMVKEIIDGWRATDDYKRNKINPFKYEYVIYPIPQAEIDVKAGLYTQNAGYN